MKQYPFNTFQRQETAKWLLSISQAAAVGGPGSYFVPGIGDRIGIAGVVGAIMLAFILYLAAMYFGRGVKNVK